MSNKEKKSQPAKEIKLSEKEVSDSSNLEDNASKESSEPGFIGKLEQSVKDLWYMSETDAEINVFLGEKADSVTKDSFARQIKISAETNIEEKDFAEFFKNLTAIQDWYGDEEKETAEKFSTVEKLLEENLTDLKVFKVGQIEIDIYVVGLDAESVLTGIKTKAVET